MYDQDNEAIPQSDTCSMQAPPAPTQPVNPYIKPLLPAEVESINNIIREAEKITAAMENAWRIRDSLRQVIADMICPWPVGTMIVFGDGKGPMDRRVVTAVLGGKTEAGEFYRVKMRVLKRGQTPGKKEHRLKLTEGLEIGVLGMFPGVLPERENGDENMDI